MQEEKVETYHDMVSKVEVFDLNVNVDFSLKSRNKNTLLRIKQI